MQRKIFYTTALILGLSSLASSHDCSTWPGTPSVVCKGKEKDKDKGAVKHAPPKTEAYDPSLLRILYV